VYRLCIVSTNSPLRENTGRRIRIGSFAADPNASAESSNWGSRALDSAAPGVLFSARIETCFQLDSGRIKANAE
jgi:hypothetical protein